jgi:uncharacterized protein (TIGR00251 family)
MKIFVKVKPNAREYRVKRVDDTHYDVAVKEPPSEGKANHAVIEVLAEHFKVPKSRVTIVRGLKSKQKTIEIEQTARLL